MTGFLLDTSVLSEFSRAGEPDRHVDRWLKNTVEEFLFASVLTFAEIRRGIELLPPSKRRTQLERWQDDLAESFEMACFQSPSPSPTAGRFFPPIRNARE